MRPGGKTVRWWSKLAVGALMASALVALGAPEAPVTTTPVAGSTYLCSGYSGCRSAGYSDGGYGANNGRMYWRMYSGHNCTNYAAYRMIQAGMSSERPWSGSGMAYNWGHANSRITDRTPAVGAIAWWDRYHNGIGSSGHVAYVEKVVSSTEIVISEDSWGGTFDWRRITKDSGRWPSGFIHFKDAGPTPLSNTAAPTVSGTPLVDSRLTAAPGTWSPTPRRFSYQWSAGGTAIAGATRKTFVPGADQVGKAITVTVTAHKPNRDAVAATTAATTRVGRALLDNSARPSIEGVAMLDETLSAVAGSWAPSPGRSEYFWRADGARIDGAGGATLRLTDDLAGKQISFVEIVNRDGYKQAKKYSRATDPVVVDQVEVTEPFTVSGRTEPGQVLTVHPGSYAPADAQVRYAWLRDGVPIPGATATTYAVTAADLGAVLSVRATLSRRNYLGVAQVASTPPPCGRPRRSG
ncbi:CHAP domain-containing protein [Nocardioides sambongensis]|uniref:CHAP domain-containing protein n=1 Tax=Nocardioides sambongensis TaxID=2589074 RepID=UPI001129204F|nr:CHAP domain-containing protein [Nocardioides sambongensis]